MSDKYGEKTGINCPVCHKEFIVGDIINKDFVARAKSQPKLLEACKKLISFCESKERLNDDGICPVEAYESAQVAIAAAKKG